MQLFLIHWLILAVAFLLTAKIVPGMRLVGLWDAIWVAAIFGILNWFLEGLLFGVIVVLTLGIGWLLSIITHWIVNAILIKITDALTSRLEVRSFGTALVAALVMSLIGKAGLYLVDVAMHHSHPGTVYI